MQSEEDLSENKQNLRSCNCSSPDVSNPRKQGVSRVPKSVYATEHSQVIRGPERHVLEAVIRVTGAERVGRRWKSG